MTTSESGTDDPWRRSHEAARALRDALAEIGVPETELQTLTARDTATSGLRVIVPPLTVDSTNRLLRALLPNLGPAFIGRMGLPPVTPGRSA